MKELESEGPIIGMMPEMPFNTQTAVLPPQARLLLYSDGVFEIVQTDGAMWTFDAFVDLVKGDPQSGSIMDRLLGHVQELHGSNQLDDDFSIVEIDF